MITLNAHFDGKTIVPDDPVSLTPNQKLRITIEPVGPAPAGDRAPGLQRGSFISISTDFNEHLGDEFWGISEAK